MKWVHIDNNKEITRIKHETEYICFINEMDPPNRSHRNCKQLNILIERKRRQFGRFEVDDTGQNILERWKMCVW